MKNLALIVIALVVSLNVLADGPKGSIQFPLMYEKKGKNILLSTLNARLKKAKSKIQFSTYLEISDSEEGYEDLERINENVAKAAKILKDDSIELVQYGTPGDFLGKGVPRQLCYGGNADKAVGLIASLTDSAFSDQLQVVAYKYRDKSVHLADSDSEEEGAEDSFPEAWQNWQGEGEDILLIYVSNDSGDDITDATIPRCK